MIPFKHSSEQPKAGVEDSLGEITDETIFDGVTLKKLSGSSTVL